MHIINNVAERDTDKFLCQLQNVNDGFNFQITANNT